MRFGSLTERWLARIQRQVGNKNKKEKDINSKIKTEYLLKPPAWCRWHKWETKVWLEWMKIRKDQKKGR